MKIGIELTPADNKLMEELGISTYSRYTFGHEDLVIYDVPVYHTSRTLRYKNLKKSEIIDQIAEVIRTFPPHNCSDCGTGKPIIGISSDGVMYCEECRSQFEFCAGCGGLFIRDTIKFDSEEVPYCDDCFCDPVEDADTIGCRKYHEAKDKGEI